MIGLVAEKLPCHVLVPHQRRGWMNVELPLIREPHILQAAREHSGLLFAAAVSYCLACFT